MPQGMRCLTPCKIIILPDKTILQWIFDFVPPIPPKLDTTFWGGLGGWGVKSLCLEGFEPGPAKNE